ncbi:MAG: hypothetical protein GC180_10220 [Bacteroidetes bacterium]|nr:hypothetical protein [Bacteroidota bacterium]
MKKLFLLSILASGLLLLSQCQKENPHVWNNPVPAGGVSTASKYSIEKGSSITMDAFGSILDEQGNPISGVKVTLGSREYYSNAQGQVKISQGSAFKNIAYFKAEKDGYFDGSRSFIPQNGLNQFHIIMMRKGIPQVFQANQSVKLIHENATIELDGSISDVSGNPYSGKVNAYVRYINPEDPDILKIMPGALRGADADGEKSLESYGMVAVELEGEGGQKLQLTKNHPATITAVVPSSMVQKAPETMPLWHFDEVYGIWSREGEGKLVNGKYVGKVSHFSVWNYDFPNSTGRFYGKLIFTDGQTLPGAYIEFYTNNRHSAGCPDEYGNYIAQVPQNMEMNLHVLLSGVEVYSTKVNLGSAAEKEMNIKLPTINTVLVHGQVLGCNGKKVTAGYVTTGNNICAPINNGEYSFRILHSMNTIMKLWAMYLPSGISQTRTVEFDGSSQVEVPAFGLCLGNGNTDNFEFSFDMNGKHYSMEGVKAMFEEDSVITFIGGKQAMDYSTDQEFIAAFAKNDTWNSKNQFQLNNSSGNWNGFMKLDIGNGILIESKLVDINVISRSPYSIEFSGTFTYYDKTMLNWVDVTLSNGKILQK